MPISPNTCGANQARHRWPWPRFTLRSVCERCGAKQPRVPFQRPLTWCEQCDALLEPGHVLLGTAGTMLLEWRSLDNHPEPVTKLAGMVVLLAVAAGAEEVVFEPTSEELRLTYLVDQVWHELVPPPRSLHKVIPQVFKTIARVDPDQAKSPTGQFGVRLSKDDEIDQIATISVTKNEFGDRVTIQFPNHRQPRPDLLKPLSS